MIATHRWALIGTALVLVCSGCTIPTLKHPLVTPGEAKPVAALYGVYRTDDCPTNLVHWVHVGPAGDDFPAGFVRIISVGQPRDAATALEEPMTYVGFLEPVGKYHVLHVPFPKKMTESNEKRRGSWDQKWDEKEVVAYLVVRLLVSRDGVEMAAMDGNFVKEQIKAKKLAGEAIEEHRERDGRVEIKNGPVTITAGTAELREFFARHIEGELFDKSPVKFARVK